MELFDGRDGALLIARWIHILAGITWIGLLYYFNFVQVPSFAQFEASARSEAVRKLVPRALWWFRYAALLTWLAGVALILVYMEAAGWDNWDDVITRPFPQGLPILTGMVLGTIMFLNVWGVIWRNQKRIIASAERVAGGGEADPAVPALTRRAGLASRTNVVMSIPMLFFMATSAHLKLVDGLSTAEKWTYALIALGIILLVELNALVGKQGVAKKPLDSVAGAIIAGFVLFGILYTVYQLVPHMQEAAGLT